MSDVQEVVNNRVPDKPTTPFLCLHTGGTEQNDRHYADAIGFPKSSILFKDLLE